MKTLTKYLKQGNTLKLTNNEDIAEVSWSDKINKYCIYFNAKLETFKSYNGMNGRLMKLCAKFDLIAQDD